MANMTDCLSTLRRRIGDMGTPQAFDDPTLQGYVADAVAEVELDFARGIEVDAGVFSVDLTQIDVTLYAVKAHYLFVLGQKTAADRNNFLLRKGTLTLDNTKQSADHKDTLDALDKEYKRVLWRVKSGGMSIQGIRME